MANRRRTKNQTKTITVRERVAPTPIKISMPRAVSAPRKHTRRRRSHGGGGIMRSGTGGSMSMNKSFALALGGFIYGYLEKNVTQIPHLPLIGKSGAIALGAYFLGGKSPGIIADVGNAASVIAGYSFGSTGTVSGGLASQTGGMAGQI